jgi:hypothetical protein
MRFILTLMLFGAWVLGCASAPEVPSCRERLVEMPPPPDACLQQADGREYLQRVADGLGNDLMSWRSGPGSAEVTIGFDAGSNVESVCLGPTVGATVSARAQAAAIALRKLPPGPACLSSRRLVLAWESPVVTHEQIMAAKLACQPRTAPVRKRISQCRLRDGCMEEYEPVLESEREKVFSECVLRALPLSFSIPADRTFVNFLPSPDKVPSKARALMALSICASPPDEPTLVACMNDLGWEPSR